LLGPAGLPDRSQWVQLTKFPDSVSEPALTPDGRVLTFIRGDGASEVYVKIVPEGEPVQLTHYNLLKTDPTFSPDGSRVAYTTLDPEQFNWDTWARPLLRNASGLVWTGPRQVLFSEIKTRGLFNVRSPQPAGIVSRVADQSFLSPN